MNTNEIFKRWKSFKDNLISFDQLKISSSDELTVVFKNDDYGMISEISIGSYVVKDNMLIATINGYKFEFDLTLPQAMALTVKNLDGRYLTPDFYGVKNTDELSKFISNAIKAHMPYNASIQESIKLALQSLYYIFKYDGCFEGQDRSDGCYISKESLK